MKLKGAFLPAELIQLFILIIVGIGMTTIAFVAASAFKDVHNVDITLRLYHLPLKYESALLAFMETTDESTGLQMKEILVSAVNQGTASNVYVKGKVLDLHTSAEPVIDKLVENRKFLLRVSDPDLTLAGNPEELGSRVYKVSTKILKANGEPADLELYIS